MMLRILSYEAHMMILRIMKARAIARDSDANEIIREDAWDV